MKKLTVFILCAMLLFTAAFAEEIVPENSTRLRKNEWLPIDLDGDGGAEKLLLRMEGPEDESFLKVIIEGTDGAMNVFDTWIAYTISCFAMDMNGDGVQEIILSGDAASDDYFTWCLNYDLVSGVRAIPFADANRGTNTDGYFDQGYGKVISVNENNLVLRGSQDVLGTWMADRVFSLENGRFELNDGGAWIMEDLTWDEFIWDYFCLNPLREVPVVFSDGGDGVLLPGEKFVITKSDKLSYADFITQDGKTGTISIEENEEDGWGYKIAGIADYDYFEYIPYAD